MDCPPFIRPRVGGTVMSLRPHSGACMGREKDGAQSPATVATPVRQIHPSFSPFSVTVGSGRRSAIYEVSSHGQKSSRSYGARRDNIRTYQASLGYLMILHVRRFSLVVLGFPGPLKALASYEPVLMTVAWLYFGEHIPSTERRFPPGGCLATTRDRGD